MNTITLNRAKRLLSVGFRALTLMSKFLLIFFLAKFLEVSDVGLYGLFSAALAYSLYVIGLEFYNFSTREIIGVHADRWLALVRDQFVLYSGLYLIFIPMAAIVFIEGYLPWEFFYWFLGLTILEHIAQEMNRLLVAMSEQLLASFVLFVRSGAWCLVLVICMWWWPSTRTINTVFIAWFIGCFISCLIGACRLGKLNRRALKQSIDWKWIKKGTIIALPLLLATLAIRGIFTLDRYFVDELVGLNGVGAYVLYIGMATAVMSFLDAGVIVFHYPKLISLAREKRYDEFYSVMKEFGRSVIVFSLFLIAACYASSYFLLDWIGKPEYLNFRDMLLWLLVAMAFYCISMIPHLGLYSFGSDKHISLSQSFGFIVFVCCCWGLCDRIGVMAIPWSMCAAFIFIFMWKSLAYYRMYVRQRALI